jgi:hypothetical protein
VFTPFHKPPYPYLYGRSVDETTTVVILSALWLLVKTLNLCDLHGGSTECIVTLLEGVVV